MGRDPAWESRSPRSGTSALATETRSGSFAPRRLRHSPYGIDQQPDVENYRILAASHAVKNNLIEEGIRATNASIVYPGARTDLFGPEAINRSLPEPPCRKTGKPLHLCFAGLLMESKAPHTLLEAIAQLHGQGYPIRASLAGGPFQKLHR